MENEPVKFKAFYPDASIVAGCYVDLSQLTPQQIVAQESLGIIPDGENEGKTCTNCGKVFSMGAAAKNRNEDFDKLCSDCQVEACSLFFGLFSDFKGE